MKVVIINQPGDGILPPTQNSIGIWSYQVARRLGGRMGVTVIGKYTSYGRTDRRRTVVDEGATYRFVVCAPNRIWSRIVDAWSRRTSADRPPFASWLYYVDYSAQAAWRARRVRPDVIHVHNFTGFVPVIRRLNPRARIVLHMNCEWLSQLDERLMERRIAAADEVFGSSDHITGLVRSRFPQHAAKCHTVYNGVDADAFGPRSEPDGHAADDDTPTIIFVGRLSPEKGLHDLIEASTPVLDAHPSARIDLIGAAGSLPREYIVDVSHDPLVQSLARFYGDTSYFDALAAMVPERHRERIRFVGALPHTEIIDRMRQAAVLVNPSYSESFGMTVVEAMACGLPTITTAVGGMQETVVDQSTGIVVPCGDPGAIAAALSTMLSDSERRNAFGRAGRQRVLDLFSWQRVAERAGERYAALASDSPASETAAVR